MGLGTKVIKELAENTALSIEEIKILDEAGWTAAKIRNAGPDELKIGVLKAGIPNRPLARVMHTLSVWAGDDGEIDHEARVNAHLETQKMQKDTDSEREKRGGLPTGSASIASSFVPEGTSAGLHHDNSGWISLGPHNVGGRTRSIAIDPKNSDRMYLASVAGGIWLTEDGGESWVPTQDLMANMAISSMVIDPTNSKTLYAGTGEGFYIIQDAEGLLGAGLPGAGIFSSKDGWSWSLIKSTKVTKTNQDFMYVNGLAISNNGKTLLAATGTGIHRSTNKGAKWTKVRASVGAGTSGCVFFDPSDNTKAISAGIGFVAYSTDSGVTWKNATTPVTNGRVQLSYAQGNSKVIYACVNNGKNNCAIWRSTDGGVKYTKQKATGGSKILGGQGNYANAIWAYAGKTRKKDIVLASGLDVYRSTDGGDQFTQISDSQSSQRNHDSAHADHHFIVPHPDFGSTAASKSKTSKTVYFGNDGGIYRAKDVHTVALTSGWENINNGFAVTQFYRGAGNLKTKIIIGGAQDNGTQGHTPGNYRWDQNWVWLGDGTTAIADPTDSSRYYGAYPMGSLFRASRRATTVTYPDGDQQLEGAWTQEWPTPPGAGSLKWLTPFILDPNNANVMYAGGSSKLYRSSSISSANGPASAKWKRMMNAPGTINDIAVIETTNKPGTFLSNRVLIGTDNGQILLSNNANIPDNDIDLAGNKPNWQNITGASSPRRNITRVFIDPKSPDTFYVCYGGFQSGNLWKGTKNGGDWDWVDSSIGLPEVPFYGISVHPQNSNWVYVVTESGLFASENGGQTWSMNNEGPANVSCVDLFWLNKTLVCVTHARGMFQINLAILGVPDAVLATDSNGTVYAMDGKTGVEENRLVIPGAGLLTAATVISETDEIRNSMGSAVADAVANTGYVADDSGNVYCIDTKSLTLKWTVRVNGGVTAKPEVWLSPDDKSIYLLVSSSDGSLTAFDLTDDHKQSWTINLPDYTSGSSIWSNRIMDNWAYLSSESGMYAIRLLGGRAVAWKDTSVACKASSMQAASVIFAPTLTGVVAYESRSGNRKWSHDTPSAVTSQPVWSMGAVVFGTQNGELIGVDHKRGKLLFSERKTGNIAQIAADDNTLYYIANSFKGSITKALVVPPGDGGDDWSLDEQWSTKLRSGSNGAPVVIDDPNDSAKIYLTTITNEMKCFDSLDGSKLWSADMENMSFATVTPIWPELANVPAVMVEASKDVNLATKKPAGGTESSNLYAVSRLFERTTGEPLTIVDDNGQPKLIEPLNLDDQIIEAMQDQAFPLEQSSAISGLEPSDPITPPSAPGAAGGAKRNPVSIAMAIDVSGSMGMNQHEDGVAYLDFAVADAAAFIYLMQPKDALGIVSFNSAASIIYPVGGNSVVTINGKPEQNAAADTLDALSAGGTTNIYDAIQKGKSLLTSTANNKNIVLLSDGKQEGVNSPAPTTDLPGYRVFTISLGQYGDTATLMKIAADTDGTWQIAKTPRDLQQVYNAIIQSAGVATALQNDQISLPPNRFNSTPSVAFAGSKAFLFLLVAWDEDNIVYTTNPPAANEVQITINVDSFPSDDTTVYQTGKKWALFKVNRPVPGAYSADLWVGGSTDINATIGIFDPRMLMVLPAAMASPLVRAGQPVSLASAITANGMYVKGGQMKGILDQPLISPQAVLQNHSGALARMSGSAIGSGQNVNVNAQVMQLIEERGIQAIHPYRKVPVNFNIEKAGGEEVHVAEFDTSNFQPGAHTVSFKAIAIDPTNGKPTTLTQRVSFWVY